MCGIVGFSGYEKGGEQIIKSMANRILHRGPDGSGTWIDESVHLFLGHRRLSILDLSTSGHQPMVSHCSRYVITFNGEIYNHPALKSDLARSDYPFDWQGSSDTEVLLASISHWGIKPTLRKIVGMYSFALWDRKSQNLYLARDRMGEKPLYYGWQGRTFLFGSELKALALHPSWEGAFDYKAVTSFLRYGYVSGDESIYKGIKRLSAGSFIKIPLGVNGHISKELNNPVRYWNIPRSTDHTFIGNDDEAAELLDYSLRQSIRGQMVADVPLGAFLSGGIDSSLVVAVMQDENTSPVQTFSIGFEEKEYNEANYAKKVARHLGTNHRELYISARDAQQVIQKLPEIFDEPFGDSSQIPTYLVSKFAKQHVSVSLSGDGGDELFGGYNRYLWASRIWKVLQRIPCSLQNSLAYCVHAISPSMWDIAFSTFRPILPTSLKSNYAGDKIHKFADLLGVERPGHLYQKLISHWKSPSALLLGWEEIEKANNGTDMELSEIENMMYLDLKTYLPEDILTKVDRSAMAVSLETRMPLLDHRIVELSASMPLSLKVRDGQGKWLLRKLLNKYVPKELIDRPKRGFAVPIDVWLRGPLREWAEGLINEDRLRREGLFNSQTIKKIWHEHLSGKRNWQAKLWDILMFQSWIEVNK